MGKVYDALKKAEEQRAQRAGSAPAPASPRVEATAASPAAPVMPAPALPEPSVPPPPSETRQGLLSRIRRRRKVKTVSREGAGALNKRRIAVLQPDSFVAEQYRTLRARIDSLSQTRPIRTIAVTSALPGDGKTISAVSLAVVTAMHLSRRVLLIDCDLRNPTVHQALGLRVDAGLAEVLRDDAKPEDAILKLEGSSLEVLPVQGIPDNPSELLASERMGMLLEKLAGSYDRVILDLPPTLGVPDAKIVSDLCDGTVFVVRAQNTPQEDVNAAVDVLDRGRILGLVLNGAEPVAARYGYRS